MQPEKEGTGENHRVFHRYGYEDIETPTFEYFEVFSREVGTIPSKELYKFFDREGNTLVLRPDFTPSVSRACATYFSPDKEPVSLCYTGNTFINNSSYRGRLKETTQMGVERIGDESADADAELLAMTVECLLAAGLTEFQVSVGQVDYFNPSEGSGAWRRGGRASSYSDLPEEFFRCGGICGRAEDQGQYGEGICGDSADVWF